MRNNIRTNKKIIQTIGKSIKTKDNQIVNTSDILRKKYMRDESSHPSFKCCKW